MKVKNICFIADGYPSEYRVVNAFVETLINAIADTDINCYVISPQSINKAIKIKTKILPFKRIRKTKNSHSVTVFSPKYVSASARRIGKINTAHITLINFRTAAMHTFEKLNKTVKIDAVYGHFIFESGIVANCIGKKYGIPAFFAYGENGTYSIDYLGDDITRKLLSGITGVVSVSSENKRVLVSKNIISEELIGVFPNSIDSKAFYKRNKNDVREKLGFPKDAFIVAFVGRFLPVKGSDRLSKAIEQLKDEDIYSVFIGEGPLEPTCERILHKGVVSHDKVGKYLSAADVFVLPTLAEGCCNAIVEAMACGLPIVSSNGPFNDDILDETCSIRINSENVSEISNAIRMIKSDKSLHNSMSKASINKASNFTICKRANNIINFIEKKIDENKS